MYKHACIDKDEAHTYIIHIYIYLYYRPALARYFLITLRDSSGLEDIQHLTKRGPSPWGRGSRAFLSV